MPSEEVGGPPADEGGSAQQERAGAAVNGCGSGHAAALGNASAAATLARTGTASSFRGSQLARPQSFRLLPGRLR